MVKQQLYCLCIGVFLTLSAHAQTTKSLDDAELFGSKYGQIVRCSLRDKTGNLWFGTTWAGLFRYDGKQFTNFTTKDGLHSNEILSIYEATDGMLWLGMRNGVGRYDGKKFSYLVFPTFDFTKLIYPANDKQPYRDKSVVDITQDHKGNLWFGIWGPKDNAGVYRYDGKIFTQFLKENPVQGLVEDNNKLLWLGSKRYDGKGFVDFACKEGIANAMVFSAYKDHKGNLWFGVRDHGLYFYDGDKFVFFTRKDGLFDGWVNCTFQDKSGRYWFGSDIKQGRIKGELCQYDGKTFSTVPASANPPKSIWTITEDKTGNLWFGGRGGQLWKYDGITYTLQKLPLPSL